MNYWYILATASMVGLIGAILGTMMMLKKKSMVADAISHSVLPGIVITYLFTANLSSWPMTLGASLTGLLTVFLIEFLQHKIKLQEDASVGIIFTMLFALGVLMVCKYTGKIDLDLDCILYGEMAYIGLGDLTVPNEIYSMGFMLLLVVLFLLGSYRHIQIITFDSAYAKSIGIANNFWNYALMSLVSLSTVLAFESVGSVLIVSFLVIPAATGYILNNSLHMVFILACCFAILAVGLGFLMAYYLDVSLAASMSVVAGFQFFLVFVWKAFVR
jgi:manganese/zinc/iron transport system permease protein